MPARSAKPVTGVPADLTSFVGRRQDITAIKQLASVARLVTLTGIGGVGKTRLAYRVAKEVYRAFADGVCLVELASLEDPALLAHTVIDALAVHEQSARPPLDVLCDHLRARQLLLVLDNGEHLVDAVADLADRVLRTAPDVTIVVTSRQALRIAGEYVYTVAPLPVPHPVPAVQPGTATQYPSVTLFAERAAAVVPGFALTPQNEAAVVRLCHRLEGIPLAIELAAVRLRVLTIDDLVRRLDDRFELLREGNRNLPERHRTLQAVIDWSHDLCTPAERMLWARASVFVGGFSGDALEAVCADELLPRRAILDTVAGLLDKSLLIREEHRDHVRFRMLETVRAYGQAQLAAHADHEAVERRHRDWCRELVETAGTEWVGPNQQDWANRLQLEHANLRRALEFCVSQPNEARVGLRMAGVPWLWLGLGYLTEGRLWLDRLLALSTEPSRERAWALASAAYLAAAQGDEPALTRLSAESRNLAVELGDPASLAFVTHVLGFRQVLSEDPASGIPLMDEALELYAEADVSPLYRDYLRIERAIAHIIVGELDKAESMVDEAFQRCAANGDRWSLSWAYWGRGVLALVRGELDRAKTDLEEALRMQRTFHDTLGLAVALDVLAWTTVASGESKRAATLLGGASTLRKEGGERLFGSAYLIARRDEFEQRARGDLGDTAFAAAFASGQELTVEETLAFALRENAKAGTEPPTPMASLTRRQLEVADLVAAGLSNKEIAAKLVVSHRTAEGHVENILTKLGLTSRTQLASLVLQQKDASK